MNSDQRKSFRILVPDGQEQAVLRAGRRELTVRIVDASAGGFALAINQTLPVKRGDVLRLRTSAGWHEVCVVRQESYTDGVFLGVERVADIDDPREMESVRTRWSDYLFLPYAQCTMGGGKAAGLFTGGALVGIVLAGFATLLANYQPPKKNESMLSTGADEVVSDLAARARKVAESMRSESPARPAGRSSGSLQASGLEESFRRASEGTGDIATDLFASWQQSADAIATRLGLSSDQRRKIDAIVADSESTADQGASATARILDVLTADQAKKLESLAQ